MISNRLIKINTTDKLIKLLIYIYIYIHIYIRNNALQNITTYNGHTTTTSLCLT